MAAELLELGLTEEELCNIAYVGNKTPQTPPLKVTPRSKSKDTKLTKERHGSSEKRHKKRAHYIGLLKSPYDSDSDSSYESDNVGYSPQYGMRSSGYDTGNGYGMENGGYDCGSGGYGRGKPFYPHSVDPFSINNAGNGETYSHVNRMSREIHPLIQMTNSAQFRNENIEKYWSNKKGTNSEISKCSDSEISKCSDSEIILNQYENDSALLVERNQNIKLRNVEPKPMSINQKPIFIQGDSQDSLSTQESDNLSTRSTQESDNLSTRSYKSALSNVEQLNNGVNGLFLKHNSNKTGNTSSDSSSKKSTDVRVKTQLYIPPHLRRRNEELAARSCDSLSSDSQSIQKPLAETQSIQKPLAETPSDKEPIANTPNDQETLAETPSAVEETQPKPVKKTVAELTRKNVLISGLLKRKQQEEKTTQQLSPASSSLSAESTGVSTCITASSSPLVSITTSSNVDVSPVTSSPRRSYTSNSLSSLQPAYNNHCDPDPSAADRSRLSPYLPSDMVEFYDIEEPEPPSAPELPLTPPPEFEDLKMKTYSYYDPDTQQHVEYQIPEIPSSPPPSVPFHRTSAFALVTGRSASSRAGSNLLPGDARNSSRGASSFAPLGGRNSPRTGRTSPSGPRTDCESYEDEFPSLR